MNDVQRRRRQLADEADEILQKAKKERRDLTDEESEKFDYLHREIERLGIQRIPPRTLQDSEPHHRSRHDDGAEVRALAPEERAVDFVARRQRIDSEDPDRIGLGQFLRASFAGAKTDVERRALSEGTDSEGGFTTPAILGAELLDRLRPVSHVLAAGAQVVPLDSDDHSFARVATDPTPSWRAENSSVSESDPAFDRVRFGVESCAFIVRASRELMEDSVNLETALPQLFVRVMASELDRVALYGDSANGEPVGIRNASGITELSQGTDGAAISDWSELLSIRQSLLEANAEAPEDFIMAPRTAAQIYGATATDGQPLMAPRPLQQVNIRESSKVLTNETQGVSTDASAVFCGGFRHLWIGQRLGVRILPLRERYADYNQIAWLVAARWDVQFDQPSAIGRIIGVTAA